MKNLDMIFCIFFFFFQSQTKKFEMMSVVKSKLLNMKLSNKNEQKTNDQKKQISTYPYNFYGGKFLSQSFYEIWQLQGFFVVSISHTSLH